MALKLNPQQLAAVLHDEGPLLILAGAGSGKTRVIVNRIARLINEEDVPAESILAVTFTNKAAEEMKLRIQELVPPSEYGGAGAVSRMWVSTFHSSCVRMLRANYERLGLIRDFVIYASDDQKTLLKECLAQLKFDPKTFNPNAVMGRIQSAKNYLKSPDAFASEADNYFDTQVAEIYRLYQQKLRSNQALDFGDLLMECVLMLQKNETVLSYYQQRFRYIMIDEYQDTNAAQYHWVRLLSAQHRNLCVVGDDDQSIYRWRGANIENILRFEDDYPGTKVIKLEQNYRSTGNILEIAASVIANNKGRKAKRLWTENDAGHPAIWYLAADDRGEATFAADQIEANASQGRSYREMAIFYRTNAQSRSFEDQFRRRNIPYVIYGGVSFYDRKEIRDMLAYLRILINPDDDIAFKRVINTPARGLGAKAVERVTAFANQAGINLVDALYRSQEIPDINKGMKSKLMNFGQQLFQFQSLARDVTLGSLIESILDQTGYRESLEKEQTSEAEDRLENIEEFLNVIAEYERSEPEASIAGFLERVALVSDREDFDPQQGAVTLMTLHLAKGLEFDWVLMAGMEEGLFPHSRSIDDAEELEEERRLCYVGVTRARQNLCMVSSIRRRLYGGDQMNLPSRFLEEMPAELIVREGQVSAPPRPRRKPVTDDWDFNQDDNDFTHFDFDQTAEGEGGLVVGANVHHPQFGPGMIRKCEGSGDNQKVIVSFQSGHVKTLLIKYAHLTLVS